MKDYWDYDRHGNIAVYNRIAFEEFKQKLINNGASKSAVETRGVQLAYDFFTKDSNEALKTIYGRLKESFDSYNQTITSLNDSFRQLQGLETEIENIKKIAKDPANISSDERLNNALSAFPYLMSLADKYGASPDVALRCTSYCVWAYLNPGASVPNEFKTADTVKNK